ncbi:MAG: 3,5-cyclic adenosine monophosphate phosphodiesterase CpdA [Chitinophagaceae bacterium]|nr:3,5-cyclic adenosine monophosphate phosphodiesterase CpdA [Chitinophagaceae bacterium]
MKYKYILVVLVFILSNVWIGCHVSQNISSSSKTFPFLSIPEKTLHFFVIGDWGRDGKYHQTEVAEAMNTTGKLAPPDFIISTGDNFYPNGVTSLQDKQWLTSFENIYSGQQVQCPWYPVLGNHDYRGNPQVEIAYTKKSSRWTMPARYYTLSKKINDSSSVRFIFLDTNPMEKLDTLHQLKWLDSVLAHSNEQWKIVVGHHPLFSSNPRHGNSAKMIALLKNRLEKHGVQLYLAGHDHDLQHQQPKGNVDYIVSGAGSQTRKTSTHSTTKFTRDISGFASISMTADSLALHFIDYKGNVIYSYKRGR